MLESVRYNPKRAAEVRKKIKEESSERVKSMFSYIDTDSVKDYYKSGKTHAASL